MSTFVTFLLIFGYPVPSGWVIPDPKGVVEADASLTP